MKYDPKTFEQKIQKKWFASDIYSAKDFDEREKKYILVEFPYPSADGLHIGHSRNFTMMDAYARFFRMKGFNVLYPMGWDAFGLPTENYAIKTKRNPKDINKENTSNFKKQMQSLGLSFDWSREIDTTDTKYYKWTQWIFLKFFENNLAYHKEAPVNWCPKCKVVCANEEVVNGKHERCDEEVLKKDMKQWWLRITAYADKLTDDLDLVDYPESVIASQRNWIGRSYGAEVIFKVKDIDTEIKVFTTRPDTLFGCTYMVVSPEYSEIDKLVTDELKEEVEKYRVEAMNKSDLDRMTNEKEKSGVFTGAYAINPVNGQEIPIWVGDYVLSSYGTGAIMAVPAHDQRDWDFAKKYNLEIIEVIKGGNIKKEAFTDVDEGIMVNSDFLNDLNVKESIENITKWLEEKQLGKSKVNYHLRDWLFSRQRYWGEPFPIIHCEKCGIVPVPEEDLPVKLPDVENYEPIDTGESPLATIEGWVNVKCPKCGIDAKRETDTMPNWAGSSWYFLRYCDPSNDKVLADKKILDYWMPVDIYEGGAEHITLHLLYSRFWHKFLYDLGYVSCPEPYTKRRIHGNVLGKGGVKMSKSLGNVINPDSLIEKYGSDTTRAYFMFMGPYEGLCEWSDKAIQGVYRFLNKFYDMFLDRYENKTDEVDNSVEVALNNLIKKVTDDIPKLKFNTSIASFMEFVNNYRNSNFTENQLVTLLKLVAPFIPHLAEFLWEYIGREYSIHSEVWPEYNENLLVEDVIEIPVQINGRVRGKISINSNMAENEVKEVVLQNEFFNKYLTTDIKKFIYVKDKIVNIVN